MRKVFFRLLALFNLGDKHRLSGSFLGFVFFLRSDFPEREVVDGEVCLLFLLFLLLKRARFAGGGNETDSFRALIKGKTLFCVVLLVSLDYTLRLSLGKVLQNRNILCFELKSFSCRPRPHFFQLLSFLLSELLQLLLVSQMLVALHERRI